MPYFIIFPIYVVLVVLGLLLGLGLLFIPRLRQYSGIVISGTIGTFPGFAIGNLLFWVIFIGIARILNIPIEHFKDSQAIVGSASIVLLIALIGGLAGANILGCGAGFIAGSWLFVKIRKKFSNKPLQPTASSGG
jgi:hypothetical protein